MADPPAVEDCRCALLWVLKNAKQFNFDVDRIVLTGDSAGAEIRAAKAEDRRRNAAAKAADAGAKLDIGNADAGVKVEVAAKPADAAKAQRQKSSADAVPAANADAATAATSGQHVCVMISSLLCRHSLNDDDRKSLARGVYGRESEGRRRSDSRAAASVLPNQEPKKNGGP